MPFCTHCGGHVADSASFCRQCGQKQPGGGAPHPSGGNWLDTLRPSTAATLCYVPLAGWVASLVVLATNRFRGERDVRFHAFQGLYLFVVWLLVDLAMGTMWDFSGMAARRAFTSLFKLSILACWIYMMVRTSSGEKVRLPILGDLAERSEEEQQAGRL